MGAASAFRMLPQEISHEFLKQSEGAFDDRGRQRARFHVRAAESSKYGIVPTFRCRNVSRLLEVDRLGNGRATPGALVLASKFASHC